MIAFSCPKCKTMLQRADAEAGTKTLCPSCNQKLLVPAPASKDQTIMGQLQPELEDRLSTTSSDRPRVVTSDPVPVTVIRCTCPHCAARIEGKRVSFAMLTTCPECGHAVHQWLVASQDAAPKVMARAPKPKESWFGYLGVVLGSISLLIGGLGFALGLLLQGTYL
ncbi:hypothetical protein AYO44_06750 [Planctomycetaceae bacterium SCGC AG-212-F19]|nr:hypothetical protein AYO44_06750 [Planctomycetaceae bacterium SCGC AG-212-F19]